MLTLHAPAKINWSLFVLDKLPNNYHSILSLLQTISVFDTLTFEPHDELKLQVTNNAQLQRDDNLILKSARALAKHCGIKKGASITLTKNIPIGAGLGGGSSDAGATLVALNKLWGCGLTEQELSNIASSIGADVPFFIYNKCAVVSGWGQIIKPLPKASSYHLFVVKPNFEISSAWAYKALDEYRSSFKLKEMPYQEALQRIEAIADGICSGNLAQVAGLLHNDFMQVATYHYPEIDQIAQRLKDLGATAVLLSGSGSAMFAVFSGRQDLKDVLRHFEGLWFAIAESVV